MSQSSLPDEINTTRPKGMLDRDLRTTLTVRDDVKRRNRQPESSENEYDENCQNNCNSTSSMRDEVNHRSGGYTYRCIHDKQVQDAGSLQKDKRISKMRLDRKYPSSRGFYRSFQRTRFGHCLLVFLCIWLASIHRTCAYPVMSDDLNLSARCKAIKDALIKPREQTKLTVEYIRSLLENYTQSQFKQPPSDVHALWRHNPAHFRYDHSFEPNEKVVLTDDFDGEAAASQLEHIRGEGVPTEEELRIEFQRIYVFLHTIQEVLNKILEDRRNNATKILHDLNNDIRIHNSINSMFEEQSKYNNFELKEVSTAMSSLKIPHPEVGRVVISNTNVEPNVGGWLTTREHLKILRYMQGVYNTFISRCDQ